jgi:hypothetical protein
MAEKASAPVCRLTVVLRALWRGDGGTNPVSNPPS